MSRRPNTAVVEIRFRVTKKCTAAQARRVIWNNLGTDMGQMYPDPDEEEVVGTGVLKAKVGRGRIVKPFPVERWTAHSGEDYSVVMLDHEDTFSASIRIAGRDPALARRIAAALNRG